MSTVVLTVRTLDVNLKKNVLPISRAAAALAAKIKDSRTNKTPVGVTQKGYLSFMILDVELFAAIRRFLEETGGIVLSDLNTFSLDTDLEGGVFPISKAASALAAIAKQARKVHKIIIITQMGYPSGVILDIDLFMALQELFVRRMEERAVKDIQPVIQINTSDSTKLIEATTTDDQASDDQASGDSAPADTSA